MSYKDRNRWNATSCGWGDLFGLSPRDLTDEQLKKLNVKKLIELVLDDVRVEKMIAEGLRNCPLEEVSRLKFLSGEETKSLPILVEAYNAFVNYREKDIEAADKNYWSNNRGDYVLWAWLNDSNKAKEFARFIEKDKKSIVDVRQIDFNWLCNYYPWLADRVITKILDDGHYRSQSERDPIPRMIISLPKEFLIRHLDSLFAKCGNTASAFVLSNPNTPEKYIIKGLRAIAGKIKVPNISMKINKKMLSALPPVMRLGLLETLLIHTRSTIEFEDISKSEDLETLLFGSVIRHSDRVKYVVNMFKRRYERA